MNSYQHDLAIFKTIRPATRRSARRSAVDIHMECRQANPSQFNTSEAIIAASSLLGLMVILPGCFTSISILSSFIHFHWGQFKPKSHLGPCYLVLMSSLWTFLAALTLISVMAHGDMVESWCQFNGICITLSTSGNLLGHTLLAFERYFLVIREKQLPWSFIIGYFCLNYSIILTALFIQLFGSINGFIPMEDGLWCFYNWTESNLPDRVASILVLIFVSISMLIIIHVYLLVYWRTRRVCRNVRVKRRPPVVSHLERQVYYRCILIIGSFVAFYSPVTFFFIYRTITHCPIAPWLDYGVALWTLFDGIATPLLVCFMNMDFRDAVLSHLPVRLADRLRKMTAYKPDPSHLSCTTHSLPQMHSFTISALEQPYKVSI